MKTIAQKCEIDLAMIDTAINELNQKLPIEQMQANSELYILYVAFSNLKNKINKDYNITEKE